MVKVKGRPERAVRKKLGIAQKTWASVVWTKIAHLPGPHCRIRPPYGTAIMGRRGLGTLP